MISYAVALLFRIIYLIIIFVCILSWIPIFDTRKEPINTCIRAFEYLMKPFRAIIPPIAGMDFSPIFAFILLQILEKMLLRLLAVIGL